MKLISWNVNGLRAAKRKGLDDFVSNERPDILCLQEIKISEDLCQSDEAQIEGYTPIFSCAEKKGYSGVATYIRKDVHFHPKKTATGIGIKTFDKEGRFAITHHKGFVLYNIYFPSGTTGDERQAFKYRFLDKVFDHIKSLPAAQQKRLIICGDVNICHKPIDIHHPKVAEKRELSGFLPDERKWMDKFTDYGFIDTFRHINGDVASKYSWWSYRAAARKKNLGWRIDYFFVAKSLGKKVKNAEILSDVPGSDHCPIQLELEG